MESLYRAGHDDIAGDIRASITDCQALRCGNHQPLARLNVAEIKHRCVLFVYYIHLCPSSALLEVAMARLAKYIWSSAGDSQARVAIVPSSLVTHLAERYGYGYSIQCY